MASEATVLGRSTAETGRTRAREATTSRGLCSTCKLASACTYPRDPERPVLQCEEFEGYEIPPTMTAAMDSSKDSCGRDAAYAENKDIGRFTRLCRTCAGRETCTYPKPEGGVWQCEEYR
jgi:hypothetical protein